MAEEEQQYGDKKKCLRLQEQARVQKLYLLIFKKQNIWNNHTLLYIFIELKSDKHECIIHVCLFPV